MIYLTLGEGVRQGVPLYSGLHDNKPPLLYITAAIAGSLFWFKVILALWMLTTTIIFWNFMKLLFPNKNKLQAVSTIIFAIFTTLPLLEGNIANAELFMVGPTILAFTFLLSKNVNFKKIFLGGALLSFASLYKMPAAFDVPAIVFFWVASAKLNKWKIKSIVKYTFYLSLGFFVPIMATFVWYFSQGALWDYVVAAYLQNIGYLSSFRPGDVAEPFYIKNLPLLIRGAVVLVGLIVLYIKRKAISWQYLFLFGWLLFSGFAITLSERPYPHYLIQFVPQISIFLAFIFTKQNKEQTLAIIPLTLAFFIPVYFNFWYYPTAPYYSRFVNFVSGKMSKGEYLASFGDKTINNYKIADFLVRSSTAKDKVFVWGDSSAIYALSRRLPPIKYVADYHIKDFSSPEEVIKALTTNLPKFIVVTQNADNIPQLELLLEHNYIPAEKVERALIWLRVSSRSKILLSEQIS